MYHGVTQHPAWGSHRAGTPLDSSSVAVVVTSPGCVSLGQVAGSSSERLLTQGEGIQLWDQRSVASEVAEWEGPHRLAHRDL